MLKELLESRNVEDAVKTVAQLKPPKRYETGNLWVFFNFTWSLEFTLLYVVEWQTLAVERSRMLSNTVVICRYQACQDKQIWLFWSGNLSITDLFMQSFLCFRFVPELVCCVMLQTMDKTGECTFTLGFQLKWYFNFNIVNSYNLCSSFHFYTCPFDV